MAGKHTPGGSAQKNTSIGRIVLIAVIVLAVVGAAVAVAAWHLTARPVEEIPGEEALASAGYDPNEFPAPAEEPEEEVPAEEPAPTDPPYEVQAPAEDETVLPEALPGAEEQVPLEEPVLAPAQADFAQIYEDAGIEPVYQLAPADGLGYAVLARGSAASGISQYEFLYDGDTVVTMAETYYSFFEGMSAEEVEIIAGQLLAESQPPEALEYVTVTAETVGSCVVLRIRMENMDDPNVVAQLSEIAFIPYTSEEYLYFTETRDRLVDTIGYAER